jgi:hypothetical protein
MKAMLDACLEKMEAKKLQINLLEHWRSGTGASM